MARSQPVSDSSTCTLAKALAPEDIRPGEFVTVLYEVREYASLVWLCEPFGADKTELTRIQYTPDSGGEPLKVMSVCLPFVLVNQPRGPQFTLDVRRVKLARLDREFAETAWKALRAGSKRKQKQRKKR